MSLEMTTEDDRPFFFVCPKCKGDVYSCPDPSCAEEGVGHHVPGAGDDCVDESVRLDACSKRFLEGDELAAWKTKEVMRDIFSKARLIEARATKLTPVGCAQVAAEQWVNDIKAAAQAIQEAVRHLADKR